VRNCLPVGMRVAALRHADVVEELAVLRVVVSSIAKLVLGHSPDETFQVEVMDELVAKFQRLEELCSWLERPSMRISDLLLGSSLDQAQWADRQSKAARRIEAKLDARWKVDAELEAL
jgi:hypothetical protein